MFNSSIIILACLTAVALANSSEETEGGRVQYYGRPSSRTKVYRTRTYSSSRPSYRTYEEPQVVRYVQREPVRYYQPRPVVRYQEPEPVVRYVQPAPVKTIRYSKPAPVRYAKDYSREYEEANYQFGYRAKASGKGYGSGEGSNSAEFGHSETRKGDNTNGKYFVLLPDGRLQTVDYYVNGDSGYVAKVSYSGGSHSTYGNSGEK